MNEAKKLIELTYADRIEKIEELINNYKDEEADLLIEPLLEGSEDDYNFHICEKCKDYSLGKSMCCGVEMIPKKFEPYYITQLRADRSTTRRTYM